MEKTTSISLGSHFEDFINSEIASGRYNSTSEVIQNALHLLELEEQKMKELRSALVAGEESAIINDFDPKNHLADLHQKQL